MKNNVSNKEVLQILTTLKNSYKDYPQGLIESRRNIFTKQVAAMVLLMNAGANATSASPTASTASTMSSGTAGIGASSMGTIMETALVIAIVAEAGVAAYVYREKIAEFINSRFGPKTEQVVSPPDNVSDFITSNGPTVEIPDGTLTVTVTETPTPPSTTNPASADNNNGDAQITSTPDPNDGNGLHLGQTKQPTKEPRNK